MTSQPSAKPNNKTIPRSKRPLPKGKAIPAIAAPSTRNFSSHEALRQLDDEQIAELALLGLRYRALGAGAVDFADPSRLSPYWTSKKLVEAAVKNARKGDWLDMGCAQGHIVALFNVGLISNEFYMEQFGKLRALSSEGAK